jgi:hypothetical protein
MAEGWIAFGAGGLMVWAWAFRVAMRTVEDVRDRLEAERLSLEMRQEQLREQQAEGRRLVLETGRLLQEFAWNRSPRYALELDRVRRRHAEHLQMCPPHLTGSAN